MHRKTVFTQIRYMHMYIYTHTYTYKRIYRYIDITSSVLHVVSTHFINLIFERMCSLFLSLFLSLSCVHACMYVSVCLSPCMSVSLYISIKPGTCIRIKPRALQDCGLQLVTARAHIWTIAYGSLGSCRDSCVAVKIQKLLVCKHAPCRPLRLWHWWVDFLMQIKMNHKPSIKGAQWDHWKFSGLNIIEEIFKRLGKEEP